MNTKVKLNLKSIIRFEQLTNKSFNLFNYADIDDITKLLYCIVIENNDERFDYEMFLELIENKNISSDLFAKLKVEIKILEQFKIKIEDDEKEKIDDEKDDLKSVIYIKDLVNMLIINTSIDVKYLMNDCMIIDLHDYILKYNNKIKEDYEKNRLFTFLQVLPHIDTKKIDTPSKFYPFAWELDVIGKEENDEIKNISENFDDIMNEQLQMIEEMKKKQLMEEMKKKNIEDAEKAKKENND